MVNVAVQDRYAETLSLMGDLNTAVNSALQRYTIDQIVTKISALRRAEDGYQRKYGMGYAEFVERTAVDEQFVSQVERKINKTWEIDLADWEFCHQGIEEWTQKLQTISMA
jgi:hypothetical protein